MKCADGIKKIDPAAFGAVHVGMENYFSKLGEIRKERLRTSFEFPKRLTDAMLEALPEMEIGICRLSDGDVVEGLACVHTASGCIVSR